jgi:hypothetical protein
MNQNSGSVSYFRLDSMAMLISVWVQIGIEGDGLEQSGPQNMADKEVVTPSLIQNVP